MNALAASRRRRVLNPRAAVITVCVLAGMIMGVRRLHSHQFDKTRQFLRTSAMQALTDEDFRAARLLLTQYLAMKPSDVEARERLSRLLVDHVGTPDALDRAFRLNEDLLRDNVPQHDLRLNQARLAVRLQRYSDAAAHLKILQTALSDSSEVWYLTGQTSEAMRHTDDAIRHYQRAIRCPQPVPHAFAALARHQDEQPEGQQAAEELLNQMILTSPSETAWRIRAEWLMQKNRHAAAEIDLWEALRIAPHSIRLNALLVRCVQQALPQPQQRQRSQPSATDPDDPRLTRVIRHFETLIAAHPQQPVYVSDLAAVLWKAERRSAAIRILETGIQSCPREYVLHRTLMEYLLSEHQTAKARGLFELLPAEGLARSDREYLQGRLLLSEGRWSDAVQVLDRCVAFCPADSEILPRARVALAMAQRRGNDRASTLEAYREVVAHDPRSVAGRLGMAAAWLDSDQVDMAIAEYRQLLDVPGVPAWLANLIIQRHLRQPQTTTDWSLVEQIVGDEPPLIADPVERTLLQADLMLAQGRVLGAMTKLEQAAGHHPDRVELSRAIRRLNGELGSDMRQRLQQLIQEQPENAEAHATLIRLHLAARDTNAAVAWMEGVLAGRQCPGLDEVHATRLMVNTLELTAQLEQAAGREQFQDWLEQKTGEYLGRLVRKSPDDLPRLAQSLSAQGKSQDVLSQIRSLDSSVSPAIQAISCLELVRFSRNRTTDVPAAADCLRQLIQRHPADADLRVVYAEILLYAEYYDAALESLKQVIAADPAHTLARARMAWILAVTSRDITEAVSLVDQVRQLHPKDPMVREIAGRIQVIAGDCRKAVDTLSEHPLVDPVSATTLLSQAAARLQLNQTDQARELLNQADQRQKTDPLLPADEQLLRSLKQRLNDAHVGRTPHLLRFSDTLDRFSN